MYIYVNKYIYRYIERERSTNNCNEMRVLHQKGILRTIPKDSFHDHDSYTVTKNLNTFLIMFLYLRSVLQRNPHPLSATVGLLSLSSSLQIYTKSFHLSTPNYRQIQICGTSRIYNNY